MKHTMIKHTNPTWFHFLYLQLQVRAGGTSTRHCVNLPAVLVQGSPSAWARCSTGLHASLEIYAPTHTSAACRSRDVYIQLIGAVASGCCRLQWSALLHCPKVVCCASRLSGCRLNCVMLLSHIVSSFCRGSKECFVPRTLTFADVLEYQVTVQAGCFPRRNSCALTLV